jgi:hypothetical protein
MKAKHRLYGDYIRLRHREGFHANAAFAFAKAMEECAYQGLDFDGERWQGEYQGFDVTIAVTYDEWADYSHYGEWSDIWEEGALENPHAGWHNDTNSRGETIRSCGNRYLKYFIPAETEEALRLSLIRYYGKALAAENARKWTQNALDRSCDPEMYVVSIQVRQAGVELAHYCVGGWEFSEHPEVDIWMECLPEAVYEARQNVHTIIKNNREEVWQSI